MNPDVSCSDGRVYSAGNCIVNVVIAAKELGLKKNYHSQFGISVNFVT